ncbi:MAG: hypothetical protein PG981_000470 [Wolbachia endosymbiont of Ctenocephalides orientis wCori]|nr:MAG: hypothetical protein PG981_000470 [Wolbachia endosymbiont of Ctenocephalides orientis wCori]
MHRTKNQTLREGRRADPGPSGQHQNILTRQAIQKSARIERSRLAKDLLDAIRDYGEESPRVATILIGLAKTFSKLENYQKQEEYVKKAVEVNRRSYGDNNHLETAKALHELGNAYFNLKEAEKAKEEYEKALKIIEGLKYSDQAIDVEFAELCNNLGSVCHALEQYQKAEVYFNKALPVFKKIEETKSFRVATVLGNLGRVYRGLNNHEKSLKSFDEALPIYKDICGNSHIEVGKIFNELGNIYYGLAKKETINDQKKEYLEQACQKHENAVTIYKKFYGNADIAAAVVLDNLAGDYRFLGNEEKAEELYTEELEIRQKYLDIQIKNNPDSIETAEEYSDLGDLYRNLGNFEGAIWSYTKELETKKKLYPKGDDISISSPLQGLGVSYYALGDYRNAAEFYKKALAIQEKRLGPNDPITRKTLEVFNELKALESLKRLYETLKEKEENYSSNKTFVNHLQLGQALRGLADAYGVLKDYKNQKFYLEKAITPTEETLGNSNPTFTRMLEDLANAKAALGASAQDVQQLSQEASLAKARDNQIALRVKDQGIELRQKAFDVSDTLFHYARTGNFKEVKRLVEKGVDVNKQDALGGTPLHIAAEGTFVSHREIVGFLVKNGANPNLQNQEGETPLHVAARYGNPKSLEILLEHRGNPNMLNKEGFSPLAKAVQANHHDRPVILLRYGANISNLVNLDCAKGIQNLDTYAKEKGYNDIVTMLAPPVKQAPKPKPPVRAVLPMPQEAGPSQAPDSTARVRSSYSYGQELQELQDLCGMTAKCRFLQVPDLTARAPSSQIVQASASEAQVPNPQLVQASVSEAQAHSSNSTSPSKKKNCILI